MKNQLINELISAYTADSEQKRAISDKKPALGWLPALFVNLVLTGLKTAAGHIKDESWRELALFALEVVGAVGEILADSDKDNAAQLEKFFKDNWQNVSSEAAKVVKDIVTAKAKDGVAKDLVLQGLDLVLVNL